MSRHSKEHHVQCPPEKVLELIEDFFRKEGFNEFLLTDIKAPESAGFADEDVIEYTVFQDFDPKWTIIVGNYDFSYDENLIAYISGEYGCTALYGHYNDQVEYWEWIHFEKGKIMNRCAYISPEWYRSPEFHEKKAQTLYEVFEEFGTPYRHYSFSHSISDASSGTLIRVKP